MSTPIRTEYVNTESTEGAKTSRRWWDEKELHLHMIPIARKLRQNQIARDMVYLRFAQLYGGREMLGLMASYYNKFNTTTYVSNKTGWNVGKACVNTAAAKIAKNKPRPLFLTERGQWSQQTRAKLLSQYVGGIFKGAHTYAKARKSFVDAGVFGTGCIKIYAQDGEIKHDRVLPHELLVDDTEALYGEPRSLFQERYIHRDVLMDIFGTGARSEKIKAAAAGAPGEHSLENQDMIYVTEAWHLPSGEGAKDGKHAICIANCTLFEEDWTKPYFPFAFFRWEEPVLGFWGAGIIEELLGTQIEINRTLRDIAEAQRMACKPRVFIENNSQVMKGAITDEIGGFVRYTGTKPEISPAPGMPVEVYNHLEKLYTRAFELTGISQLAATSRKPAGLNSGIALQEYNDIETERFALVGQQWEDFHMTIAEISIDLTRDMLEQGQKPSVTVKGGKWMRKIDWKEVDLENDKFIMQAYPASLLPSTPSGRLEKVDYLISREYIPKEHGLALLDFPDVEGFISLQTAAVEDWKMVIEEMIEHGRPQTPEPFMDLNLGLSMLQHAYLQAKMDGVPEERLELVRSCIRKVLETMRDLQPEQPQGLPAPQPGAPEAPTAQPGTAGAPASPPNAIGAI